MAYDSFRAELEEKADKIASMHVAEIQELDGKTLVEFRGTTPPGLSFCGEYGLELIAELDGEQAAEAGAETGHKIAVFA